MTALAAIRDRLFASGPQRLSFRRLLAFAVATWLVWEGKVGPEEWEMVAMVFIAAEVAEKWKPRTGGPPSNTSTP